MDKTDKSFKKFKKAPLVFSLLIFSLAIALFLFIYNQIEGNIQKAADLDAQWQTEEKRRNELQSIDVLLTTLQTEREFLGRHFIQSSDIVPLLNSVELLALQAGAEAEVTLVDLGKDNSALAVGVIAQGSFESIYKFLRLLENSSYELDFNSVSLQNNNPGDIKGWSGIFQIKILSFIP